MQVYPFVALKLTFCTTLFFVGFQRLFSKGVLTMPSERSPNLGRTGASLASSQWATEQEQASITPIRLATYHHGRNCCYSKIIYITLLFIIEDTAFNSLCLNNHR